MENLSLEQLIAKRTNVKAQITRFSKYVNAKKSVQLTVDDIAELSYKLNQFEQKKDIFNSIQEHIELLDNGNEAEHDLHEEIDNTFCTLIVLARSLIKNVNDSNASEQSKLNSCVKQNIHVNLPTFDGNFSNSNSFKDKHLYSRIELNYCFVSVHMQSLLSEKVRTQVT